MAGRNNNNDAYSRLDFDHPPPPGDDDDYSDDERDSLTQQRRLSQQQRIPVATSPVMDPRFRTPSPAHPLAGYQLDDQQPYRPQRQNTGGYPAQMPGLPDNNPLAYQPSVSPLSLELPLPTFPSPYLISPRPLSRFAT